MKSLPRPHYLKRRPVVDLVATATLAVAAAAMSGCQPGSGAGGTNGTGAAAPVSHAWQEYDITDKMDPSQKSVDAETTLVADTGDSFDAKAECTPGFVAFTLTDYAKGAELETSQTQSGDEAFFLRTRLDSRDVTSAHSDIQYTNEASIFFFDPDIAPRSIADGVSGEYGRVMGGSQDASTNATSTMVSGLAGLFSAMAAGPYLRAAGAGTLQDLEASNNLRIEVPMADGRHPVVTVNLRDPTLRDFFELCQQQTIARYPPHADRSNATADDAGTGSSSSPAPQQAGYPQQPADAYPPQPTYQQQAPASAPDSTDAGAPPRDPGDDNGSQHFFRRQ